MASIEDRLRIGPDFQADEHDRVTQLVLKGRLSRRLSRWEPADVELEISVKDRDTNEQRMTLECWIAGVPRMVATSTRRDLEAAVLECRDDLYTQIDRYLDKQESQRRR